jgi:hypothetical protein
MFAQHFREPFIQERILLLESNTFLQIEEDPLANLFNQKKNP